MSATRNPFKVGDRALHKSGTLDSRPVSTVEGSMIRLRIGSVITDPVLAADYKRIPRPKEADDGQD